MPSSAGREQDGTSVRLPATSTTHTRHTLTGVEVLGVADRRRVDTVRVARVEDRGTRRHRHLGTVDAHRHVRLRHLVHRHRSTSLIARPPTCRYV